MKAQKESYASSDTTYKFIATEDKVYNFTDTKVSEDVKEFSIYDNDLNNISTDSIKKSKVTYNENNEPKVDYITYKIYLKKEHITLILITLLIKKQNIILK